MNAIDATHDKRQARAHVRARAWSRMLGWTLALIAVFGVFVAWLDPHLMVALGNAVWSCF